MKRRVVLFVLFLFYFWISIEIFRHVAPPVYFDGGGPMPSFHWWRLPPLDLREYRENQLYYDTVYFVPYVMAGVIATVVACVITPRLLQKLGSFSAYPFLGSAALTFGLLALLAFASDCGSV